MVDNYDVRVREHLADFITARMLQLGMSNADLARELGEDDSKTSKIRRGLHTPSLSYAVRLAEVLQCSLADFDPPKDESKKNTSKRRFPVAS